MADWRFWRRGVLRNLIDDPFGKGERLGNEVSVGNADQAMRLATVWACVRRISEQVASLPVHLWQVAAPESEGSDIMRERRIPRRDLDQWMLVARRPNSWQTSFEWREMMVQHLLLRGVGYSQIVWDKGGRPTALWPLHPDSVTPELVENDARLQTGAASDPEPMLEYRVHQADGTERILPQKQVLHLRGMYSDLLTPMSPIAHHRELLETQQALRTHEHRTYARHGARPGGVIETEKGSRVKPEELDKFIKAFNDKIGGPQRSGKTYGLPQGLKWNSVDVSFADQQFIEQMRMTRLDICNVFGYPIDLLDPAESKYATAQAAGQALVTLTLRPLLERFEGRLDKDLLGRDQQRTIRFKLDASALLRGSPLEETSMHVQRVQGAVETPNEARIALDLDIDDNPAADQLYVQMNQEPVGAMPTGTDGDPPAPDQSAAEALAMGGLVQLASLHRERNSA